ncbi:MAG: tRNA lysidine(34) synthetase TilS [Planctomycetales bacterium]
MADQPLFVRRLHESLARLEMGGQALLLGVSGGADSVALLRGCVALGSMLKLQVSVAHLNHRLRGAASDADAAWLEALCRSLAIPLTVGVREIADLASGSGRGIEEAARDERYAFLEQAARDQGCSAVAVAHTADDQAETILHHILRGTGLAGLGGMPPARRLPAGMLLIRPLLEVRRTDVLEYLRGIGQEFREDQSNQDEAYTRNRLRRRWLPDLARDFNPQLTVSLCRLGQQAAQAQSALAACAEELLDKALETFESSGCRIKWQPLRNRPRHLIRELFGILWRRNNWPRQGMTFEHWDRLAEIVVEGGAADFPGGIHVQRAGKLIEVEEPDRPKPTSGAQAGPERT